MHLLRWFSENYQADRYRLFYWLPVAMALGAAHYFTLTYEPSPWPYVAAAILAGGGALRWYMTRPDYWAYPFLLLLALGAFGVLLAQAHTLRLQTPFLAEGVGPLRITGTIASIDRGEESGRIVLTDLLWPERERPTRPPQQIRLMVKDGIENLAVGQRVRALASIQPPALPVMPGGYDFARQLFFDGIGGVGFTMGQVEILRPAEPGGVAMAIQAWRDRMIQRVFTILEGDQAAVSAALITSEDDGLSAQGRQDMRQSGLQHILSVSGLHLTLVGGLVFLLVRYLVLWLPRATVSGKKIAAVAALFATLVYLIISGFAVPTQRAFIMIALVFLAVLADREALSLRLVALSALAIIALRPDAVMGVSFQLSFAAVTALIAVYESWRPEFDRHRPWWSRIGRYFMLSIFTTLIATVATTPIVIYHFHQMTLQGALANALAAPLTTFWLMPAVVLTLFAWPLGLEAVPIWLLGQGVDWLLALAKWTASLPGAKILIPATGALATGMMIGGGLWILLWQQRWRWLGVFPLLLGIVLAPMQSAPDILINNRGNLYAVRDAGGTLWLSAERRDKFSAENWLNFYAQDGAKYWRDWPDAANTEQFRCDAEGCWYQHLDQRISFATTKAAVIEDCAVADVVITPLAARDCAAGVVIDKDFIRQNGAVAIWLGRNGAVWQSNRSVRGYRPWSQADWSNDGQNDSPDLESRGGE